MHLIKKISIIMAIMFLGLSSFNTTSHASESNKEKVGNLYNLVISHELGDMPKDIIELYEKGGWTIEKDLSYRKSKITDGTVFVNDEETAINDSGDFEVPQDQDTIEVKINEDEEPVDVTVNENGVFIVTNTINLESLIESMDAADKASTNAKGYGDKYKKGDTVHCNRFNGPLSDNVHYSKSKNPVKAARNFAGSDCDLALLVSTMCYKHNYCNIKGPAAACSTKIGHSAKYHKHLSK